MGPHPETPVDVQKYIGSYLITQQPRSKRKSCPRTHHQKDGGGSRCNANYGGLLPSCNRCNTVPIGSGGGFHNLNNYAWTGVPLISVARHKNQYSKPRTVPRPNKPLIDRDRADYITPHVDTSEINLEDILPISRLAIHAQGAPLILSPKDSDKTKDIAVKDVVDGFTFKGHDFYLSNGESSGHFYVLMSGEDDASKTSRNEVCFQEDTVSVSGDSDLMPRRQVSSPSQSDCISTTSEDSGSSENGLPRIIKPRKRRRRDRRTSEGEGMFASGEAEIPGTIVTLKPYQPLCYSYNNISNSFKLSPYPSPPTSPKVSQELCDTVQINGNTAKIWQHSVYPYPPSSRCRCPYCVPPPSTFLTPPDSPVDISEDGLAMAVARGRRSPYGSNQIVSSNRELEIKFLPFNISDDDLITGLDVRGQQTNNNTLIISSTHPPPRPWICMADPESKTNCTFTVMCYNILCDKYATRQMYGYCPNWALNWAYRKKSILQELLHYKADIISLQEVETEQFYKFFLPELQKEGYDGIFSPKSRAKTMAEMERKHVDGCAIFYKTSKFQLLREHLVEFNQLAMANAKGSDDMLNRVMTKDNIGLAALLQTRHGAYPSGSDFSQANQTLLVCTAHIHWDPEYSDVKLIQTMMLMHELKTFVDEILLKWNMSAAQKLDPNIIPLILCGDFNSLPNSGVIEYLSSGRVSASHCDFKEFVYKDCLSKLGNPAKTNEFTHPFKITRAYSDGVLPFTNYSYDFKGVIDYVFYSKLHMNVMGVLGPMDSAWLEENRVQGCPHPHIPSDHFPIVVELQLNQTVPTHPTPPNGVSLHR